MKLKLAFYAGIVLLLFAFNYFFPFREYLVSGVKWFEHQGTWAMSLYFLIFVGCTVFLVPVGLLIMGAGALYGYWRGYLLIAAAVTAGISITYVLGKKLWRKQVEQLRRDNPRFEAIYEAVSRRALLLVFLIRLNPFLPFTILNYLFTVPKLDFRKYLLMSLLGISPDIFFFLYLGRISRGILDERIEFTIWNGLVLGVAGIATVAVGIIINNLIRKAPLPPKGNTLRANQQPRG